MSDKIALVANNKRFLAFKSEKKEWGVFEYQTGTVKKFDTEKNLQEYLHKTYGVTAPLTFLNLKTFYNRICQNTNGAEKSAPLSGAKLVSKSKSRLKQTCQSISKFSRKSANRLTGVFSLYRLWRDKK